MLNVADFTITSLETIQAFELDGTPAFVLDELQDATISNTEEKEDITGKGGRKLSSLKKNKAVTISGTNGLISAGLLAAQVGGEFANKTSTPIKWSESVVINSDAAATSFKAVGTAGAEIEALYVKNTDGTLGEKLEQGSAAGEGVFAYAPTTKALTFEESAYDDGTEVYVVYTRNIAGHVVVNDSEKYSKKMILYIDGLGEDKCGKIYRIQFHVPKADFSGEFEIAMGDTQTVHAFEAESLAGGCGAGGTLWTYTVFDSAAADATA